MDSASGSTRGLPGIFPVAESSFLAYSCAAARDLHPLPNLRRAAKTHVPNELTKSKNNRARNLTPQDEEVKRGAAAALPFKAPHNVEQERKEDADEDGSRQRKVEDRVLAAVNKVSRQSPQRQIRPPEQSQHHTCDQKDESEEDQQLSQACHTSHGPSQSVLRISCDSRNPATSNARIECSLGTIFLRSTRLWPWLQQNSLLLHHRRITLTGLEPRSIVERLNFRSVRPRFLETGAG